MSQFVQFDIYSSQDLPTFDVGQNYLPMTANAYTAQQLSEMGAALIQIGLLGEDGSVYMITGSFECGAGGDYGMEVISISVDSLRQVTVGDDGEAQYQLMTFPSGLSLTVCPQNVQVVWTQLVDSCVQDEAADAAYLSALGA